MSQTQAIMKTLLITGLGRSGSTLVQKVVNAHPSVFVSDESWHFLAAARRYAERNRRTLMGMSDRQYAGCIGHLLSALYASVAGDTAIQGDKCPPAFTYLDDIRTLVQTQGRELAVVWTVRHPYDIALSWIERFREKSLLELSFYGIKPGEQPVDLPHMIELIFQVWLRQQVIMRQHPGYTVIYEQMTSSPEGEMARLHEWLGLSFSMKQLSDAFASGVIGGDPKFASTRVVHDTSRFRYRRADAGFRQALETAGEKAGIQSFFDEYGYDV